MPGMRRREFITLLGGAATVWPIAASAQQPAMPVIGLLGSVTARQWAPFTEAFLQGLSESGIVEGRNATVEYRWAEGQYDRLPALAAELVQREVAVIAALTTPAAVGGADPPTHPPQNVKTHGVPGQIGRGASRGGAGGAIKGVADMKRGGGGKRVGVVGHFRVEHLDRDVAMQPGVVRAIDLTHPPAANQAEDVVRSEASAGGKAHGAFRGGAASRF